eukprot:TRINITY_DN93533_c0_g1_i1.p1 TRINITY_DN93533_c0_g1~~TRINITY_DN93533_c0_g1_i1.p1  ORF type:complete len:118 (-),score=36.17 TRINITY_DN93533_c0_g1_i1:175-528(-)
MSFTSGSASIVPYVQKKLLEGTQAYASDDETASSFEDSSLFEYDGCSSCQSDGEKEVVNVANWGSVGKRIFQRLAELDAEDPEIIGQEEKVDVVAWGGVGAQISRVFSEFEDSEDDF